MFERFKSPAFLAMVIAAICTPLVAMLNGQMDLKAFIASAISGLVAGILGILQPQPAALTKPPVVPPSE